MCVSDPAFTLAPLVAIGNPISSVVALYELCAPGQLAPFSISCPSRKRPEVGSRFILPRHPCAFEPAPTTSLPGAIRNQNFNRTALRRNRCSRTAATRPRYPASVGSRQEAFQVRELVKYIAPSSCSTHATFGVTSHPDLDSSFGHPAYNSDAVIFAQGHLKLIAVHLRKPAGYPSTQLYKPRPGSRQGLQRLQAQLRYVPKNSPSRLSTMGPNCIDRPHRLLISP